MVISTNSEGFDSYYYIGKDNDIIKNGQKCLIIDENEIQFTITINKRIINAKKYKKKYFVSETEYRKIKINKLLNKSRNTFYKNIIQCILKKVKK